MLCLLTLVNALGTNMNKQRTTVFLLTNINCKKLYLLLYKSNKCIIHYLFILVNALRNVNTLHIIVKCY